MELKAASTRWGLKQNVENVALSLCIGYLSLEALGQMVGMCHMEKGQMCNWLLIFLFIL